MIFSPLWLSGFGSVGWCVDGFLVRDEFIVAHHRVDFDLILEMLDPGSHVLPDLADVIGAYDRCAPAAC